MIGAATLRPPGATRGSARNAWRPAPPLRAAGAPTAFGADRASHPLGDAGLSAALRRRATEIDDAFAVIEPTLQALATRQFEPQFVPRANAELADRLGFTFPDEALATSWLAPLDMRTLYARAVLRTFCRLVERAFDRGLAEFSDGESAPALIARWGFHAIDITPCADGRLSGVVDFILRVPPAVVVSRQSYAGAMFDVEETLRRWERVELGRWREGRPNAADMPTHFLKIGVYHFSSSDPQHEGCAAHGSDDVRAAHAVLERLDAFATAVQQTHCCGAAVRTLLIGVDTDTDAIRVHVPDPAGRMSVDRFVDNRELFGRTLALSRDAAKNAIRDAVAACAGAAADDGRTEGMRWFCGYLLKNNIGQIDAVRAWHGGAYADRGHTERLIVVGDPVDDVQLRNLAFQAQMNSVEEGASDLDVGVRILRGLNVDRGLAIPVLVNVRYDARIPGSAQQARLRADRLRAAIQSRYADLAGNGMLYVEAVVRSLDGSPLVNLESPLAAEFAR